jgi:hypothetical protein
MTVPRRPRSLTALTVVILVALGACSSSSDPQSSAESPTPNEPSDPTTVEPASESQTSEAVIALGQVTLERDDEAATAITIGVDGGTLSTTSADGTVFQLTVPAGALSGDTTITATPARLDGVPFPTTTVMFEPTGLQFITDATLTVTPVAPAPVAEQFMYELNDDATEFNAALPVLESNDVTFIVSHFSGYGLATTNDPGRAAMLERSATDAAARLRSRAGQVLQVERAAIEQGQEPSDLTSEFESLFDDYERDVVKPRLEAAGSSCEAANTALQTVLEFERDRSLMGFESGSLMTPALEIAFADDGQCEQEAIARCKAAKDPAILLTFWLSRERQQQLMGLPAGSAGLGDLVMRARTICKPVTYTASGGGSGGVVSGTVADVAVPFTLDVSFAGGSAVLSFAPANRNGGTYSYEGSLVSGGGSYTIAGEEGGSLTLNYSGNGCAVGGQCAATSAVVTLTPND